MKYKTLHNKELRHAFLKTEKSKTDFLFVVIFSLVKSCEKKHFIDKFVTSYTSILLCDAYATYILFLKIAIKTATIHFFAGRFYKQQAFEKFTIKRYNFALIKKTHNNSARKNRLFKVSIYTLLPKVA